MKTAYKVVKIYNGGNEECFISLFADNIYELEYKLGETLVPVYPAFLFNKLKAAREYVESLKRSIKNIAILKCKIERYSKRIERVCGIIYPSYITDFWEKGLMSYSVPVPKGTILARKIYIEKVIERI